MRRSSLVIGVASAAPIAFLLLPDWLSSAILGTWAFVAFALAGVFFMLTGIITVFHWWHGLRNGSVAAQETLEQMGYAKARNAKQAMGGHHGRP